MVSEDKKLSIVCTTARSNYNDRQLSLRHNGSAAQMKQLLSSYLMKLGITNGDKIRIIIESVPSDTKEGTHYD